MLWLAEVHAEKVVPGLQLGKQSGLRETNWCKLVLKLQFDAAPPCGAVSSLFEKEDLEV